MDFKKSNEWKEFYRHLGNSSLSSLHFSLLLGATALGGDFGLPCLPSSLQVPAGAALIWVKRRKCLSRLTLCIWRVEEVHVGMGVILTGV